MTEELFILFRVDNENKDRDEGEDCKLLVTRIFVHQIRKQELSATVSHTPKKKSNCLVKFISCCKHTKIVNSKRL